MPLSATLPPTLVAELRHSCPSLSGYGGWCQLQSAAASVARSAGTAGGAGMLSALGDDFGGVRGNVPKPNGANLVDIESVRGTVGAGCGRLMTFGAAALADCH